jgi:hypothetical protein
MKKFAGVLLAMIILATSFGCIPDERRHDYDRDGYRDRDRDRDRDHDRDRDRDSDRNRGVIERH